MPPETQPKLPVADGQVRFRNGSGVVGRSANPAGAAPGPCSTGQGLTRTAFVGRRDRPLLDPAGASAPLGCLTPGWPAVLGLCLVAQAGLSACQPAHEPPRGVLLMTLDSVRRDHVSAYGYRPRTQPNALSTPHLDALAERGILFENAFSSTSWTLPAHVTLLTGLPDQVHGVTRNDRQIPPTVTTLAEAYAAAGYRTQGYFSGPNLHPAFGFAQGFERYHDCSGVQVPAQLFTDQTEPERDDRFLDVHVASHQVRTSPLLLAGASDWLRNGLTKEEPFFLFVHWWDPHYDYLAPPEFVRRFADPAYQGRIDGCHQTGKFGPWTPVDVEQLKALYAAEIAYTDQHVGELLAVLDELERSKDTLVVLTSDHGEEFYEHGRWGHQRTLFEEVLAIPLALAWPARWPAARRVASPVQLIDIFATLLTASGLEQPEPQESRDLAPLFDNRLTDKRDLYFFLDVPQREIALAGIRRNDHKLILDQYSRRPTYLDLKRDPGEQAQPGALAPGSVGTELYAQLGSELKRCLESHQRWGFDSSGAGSALTADLEQALRDAGYLQDD
jgi:arylsulfatase A-like enzyme